MAYIYEQQQPVLVSAESAVKLCIIILHKTILICILRSILCNFVLTTAPKKVDGTQQLVFDTPNPRVQCGVKIVQ